MEFISEASSMGKDKGEITLGKAVAAAAACFLISRVCFLGQMFPAGVALLAVLISTETLGIYLLPVMLLGLGTFCNSGIPLWGDLGALCGCSLLFLCMGKIRFALWHKAVISGTIVIIANSVYFIVSGLTYGTSLWDMVLEGALAALLCLVFQLFFNLLRANLTQGNHLSAGIGELSESVFALAAVGILLLSGVGFSWILLPGAMILTLLMGYLLGVSEGLVAGFTCGFFLFLGSGMPGTVMVLAAGGAAAGFLKGQNKTLAALCFGAVTTGLGFMELTVSLALPYYGALSAVVFLAVIPKKMLLWLDAWLSTFLRCSTYPEKRKGATAACYLDGIRDSFEDLSSLFASQENSRMLLAYQFKAMSRIMEHTARTISREKTAAALRYEAEPAGAGYARNQEISGDSYMWTDLEDGRFAIVLSDGMGKGKRAAKESSLAVSTVIKLLKAGLEVELVLKLLNSILLLKAEDEIFATMDLGIFNRKNGKMKFYKIGAATTFIKRKYSVETVKVSAMPMGIVDGLKIDYVTVNLNPGDQVIMISDGVTDSRREDLSMDWLQETIGEIRSRDPQTMCDLIMNRAVENYGLKEKDDLTVLAVRVN